MTFITRNIFLSDKADDSRGQLIAALRKIHSRGWIVSKRLNHAGVSQGYESLNGGGYTLEAELGIRPNSRAKPDFMGWEIKQYAVNSLGGSSRCPITLMTPEPTGGYYKSRGVAAFIHKYGYQDKKGHYGRSNFCGLHKYGQRNKTTGLVLRLKGYDKKEGKITNLRGMIMLVDKEGIIAASWNFENLQSHWTRKHNKVCYIPAICYHVYGHEYQYGHEIILNTGADFELFLQKIVAGQIYYDPGIKMETGSGRAVIKRRSQFRIKFAHLIDLYRNSETVDLRENNISAPLKWNVEWKTY